VCLVSIYNSHSEIKKLFHALAALAKSIKNKNLIINDVITNEETEESEFRLTPEKAFNSSSDFVSPDMAIGRINKRIVYRMPDEIPIIIPGEKIKNIHLMEISKILSTSGTVKGLTKDNRIEVVGISDTFGI